MTGKHCPHMQSIKLSSLVGSKNRHDCCNDATTVAKTGQLCKTGQECSSQVIYIPPPTMVLLALTSDAQQLPAIPMRTHTGPPPAVWRPPALV